MHLFAWQEQLPGLTYLDVTFRVKSIELVEQLQHGSLNLALTARVGLIPVTVHRKSGDKEQSHDNSTCFYSQFS